jgi:alkylation response protein AidB-like acyl-CoA dehydrogenase
VEAILNEAAKFATEVLAPINAQGDRQGCKCKDGAVTTADGFKEAYSKFIESGWNAMPASPEFGGQGLPSLVSTPVLEMWKASNLAFSLCQMLTLGAVAAIAHHGSERDKHVYLPRMVSGVWTGTMNLTEPQAGSDLSAVRTKAEPEGDHYRISGTKIFITWASTTWQKTLSIWCLRAYPTRPRERRVFRCSSCQSSS